MVITLNNNKINLFLMNIFVQLITFRYKMGLNVFTAIFLIAYLVLPDKTLGGDSSGKSRLELDRRQYSRIPLLNLLLDEKEEAIGKRQEHFDDYGHMRFGKRGEESDDYGHMRFGKRD